VIYSFSYCIPKTIYICVERVLLLFGCGKKDGVFAINRKLSSNPILLNLSLQNKNYTILLPNPHLFFYFSQTQHRRPAISSSFLFFLPPKPSFLLFLFFIYKKPELPTWVFLHFPNPALPAWVFLHLPNQALPDPRKT
jgi:hypothetical protein